MDLNTSNERQVIAYFWQVCLRHKRHFILGLGVPVGAIFLNTILPFFMGKILADLGTNINHASSYIPFVIAAGVIGALINRVGFSNLMLMQAKGMSDLQRDGLDALLRQSVGFHNNRVAGKLVSDAIDMPASYGQLAGNFFANIIPFLTTVVSGIAVVMWKSWLLGSLLLVMTVVVVGSGYFYSRRRRPLRMRRLKATKDVTAHLADVIVNNHTVKTFAREDQEMRQHTDLNAVLREQRMHDWNLVARDGSNRVLALIFFEALFTLLIIHLVKDNPAMLSVGIFAFTYSITLTNNMFNINNMIRTLEDGLLQAAPMMDILKRTPDILDKPGSKTLTATSGAIKFDTVSFRYKDAPEDEAIFSGLTLSIAPGEKIGLVGPSGGGKSTLTRLLLRFDDIQDGVIAIDGQNIAKVTQQSLRQAISYVPQEPLLFHRSVLENIAYGNEGTDREAIIAAAKKAQAHDFISDLPAGYDTLVGERGVKLSGGQRQRIAIARAILKDAPILVLDEATSALDSESEVLIQKALTSLMQNKTAIVVAHRLSTIQKMDRIIVLENGAIREEGSHAQLLKHKAGLYAKLWKHQSGGFLED